MKINHGRSIKIFAILILASSLVLTGFGCKGLSAEEQAAVKPVVLEYWTVFDDVTNLRALAAKYMAQRPYIRINIRQLRQDEIYNRFVEALADDKGPDIISVNVRSLGKYLSRLQPMPATVSDAIVTITQGKMGGENVSVSRSSRALIDVNKLKSEYIQTVYDDVVRSQKIYGLPLSFDVMGIYYNKDLLDRAGIPEPPKTWEEFQGQAKLLTKFDKTNGKLIQAGATLGTGENIPSSSDLLYLLYTQSKLPFISDSGRVSFHLSAENSPSKTAPGMQVVDFYTDFANPTKDTYTWNAEMPNALESFSNGQAAFFFGYSYQYPIIKSRAPQLNFAVIPMLQLTPDSPVNVANYWLQTVPLKSKNSNEAWAFVDYLTHSAATKEYLDKTKRPSAFRSFVAEQKKLPELAPFAEQMLVAKNWYRGKDFDAADKAIQTMFTEWLQTPPEGTDLADWRMTILSKAASKVTQTMTDPK